LLAPARGTFPVATKAAASNRPQCLARLLRQYYDWRFRCIHAAISLHRAVRILDCEIFSEPGLAASSIGKEQRNQIRSASSAAFFSGLLASHRDSSGDTNLIVIDPLSGRASS
jgi:hypothetical protein